MASYNGCTQKQIEALLPLEADAKRIKKRMTFLQKKLALEHAIGFEENREIHAELKELEKKYAGVSVKIAEIYGAEKEMRTHISKAWEEFRIAESIGNEWGIVL